MLKLYRNGAVGFIDWLGVLFIAELLMHRKSAEKKPSAFDAFLAIELKALAASAAPEKSECQAAGWASRMIRGSDSGSVDRPRRQGKAQSAGSYGKQAAAAAGAAG
jgi:hypothetical protein